MNIARQEKEEEELKEGEDEERAGIGTAEQDGIEERE